LTDTTSKQSAPSRGSNLTPDSLGRTALFSIAILRIFKERRRGVIPSFIDRYRSMKRNPRFAAGAQSRLPGFNESGSSKPGITRRLNERRFVCFGLPAIVCCGGRFKPRFADGGDEC